jgi:AraC-like DNA-binding protein
VVCTFAPSDRTFEERHTHVDISFVLSGTFQYRSSRGSETLVPGSVLLGNQGRCFECGHEHAAGDRCVAFHYAPAYFEEIRAAVGAPATRDPFQVARIPPLRELSRLIALATSGVLGIAHVAWEELVLAVASTALRLGGDARARLPRISSGAVARVTESVRAIEAGAASPHSLESLASAACMSPFHYLRTFKKVTGVTPHQFVMRTRLREAAAGLGDHGTRIIDVALDAGFGDLSNFNHAFRAEIGATPTEYRTSVMNGPRRVSSACRCRS